MLIRSTLGADFLTLSIKSCKRKEQVVEQVCKQQYFMSVILTDNTLTIFTFFLFPNLLMRSINQKNTPFFLCMGKILHRSLWFYF